MTIVSTDSESSSNALDDQGTSQTDGRKIVRDLREQAFDSNDGAVALALGRPEEEVTGLIDGSEPLDDDLLMKARAIARERGVHLEGTDK
jgi:hypothetical protein